MDIILVKPWGKDQGEYVRVDAADFDPAIHERCEPEPEAKRRGRPAKTPETDSEP